MQKPGIVPKRNEEWNLKTCKSNLDIVSFNEQGSCLSLTVVEESGDMDNILITDSNKQ